MRVRQVTHDGRPAVSVVVPAYNAERTVGEMIESVLQQTFGDFELVICDDASLDQTQTVIRSFRDPRIKVVRNATNLGEGHTRDHAIGVATGRWLAVLDADDAWEPHRLAGLLAAVDDDQDTMIFDDILECHDTAEGMVPWRRLHGPKAFGSHGKSWSDVDIRDWLQVDRMLIKPIIPNAFVKRTGIVHSTRKFSADTEFFLKLLICGLRMRYVPVPGYRYRLTPGSMSAIMPRAPMMRSMLLDAMPEAVAAPLVHSAIAGKIERLNRYERYRPFVQALKQKRPLAALATAIRNPACIPEFVARASRELSYHAHRAFHRGMKR